MATPSGSGALSRRCSSSPGLTPRPICPDSNASTCGTGPPATSAWSGHERAADIRFEVCDGGPLWTRAHRPLLGQLLDNLLENACKYSEPGTPITVRAWCEPDAVALAVEDCGDGISALALPHVFEPFYRAESARRLGRAGVGLGLAVARRIAAAHGGTITIDSEPGRGSRFVVCLPRVPAPNDTPDVVDRREALTDCERALRDSPTSSI